MISTARPDGPAVRGREIARLVRFVWCHRGNRRHRCRALSRLVLWQVWQRVVRRPLTVPVLGGLRLRCHPHSHAAALVLYCRAPEWEHMNFVRDFLRPGDVFVDVGANVGSYSLLAAATPDVEVRAYEPSTLAYDRLVDNIALNSLDGRITARRVAVGASGGEARISLGNDALNRVLAPGEGGGHEMVPMGTLDETVAGEEWCRVRLVKVDVEGGEADVLRGAAGLLGATGPVVIAEANDVAAVRAVLEPLGYRAYAYDPDARALSLVDWFDVRDNNLLALRDPALAVARLEGGPSAARAAQPPASSPPAPGTSGIGGRISWVVADQGLSSLSNVGTSIVAARALSTRAFGAFALVLAVYSLVLGLSRGAVSEVLVSTYSHHPASGLRPTLRTAAGAALDLGLLAAIAVAAAGAAVGGATWTALGALALVLPGLLLQDAWRYCFVTSRRPRAALGNDALWCAVQVAALPVLLLFGHLTLLTMVWWWGLSGVVAGAAGCVQAGLLPGPGSAIGWITGHRELSWRYAMEFAVATGAGQVALVLLGALAGLAALGAVRGALVFFGMVVVLFNGAFLALAAEGVRLRSQPAQLRRLMERASTVLVLVALGSLGLGVVLPAHLGTALFGATWLPARRVFVPIGVATAANCAAAGAIFGLRALNAARSSLRARLVTAPVIIGGPLACTWWGPRGFAIGLALSYAICAVVWWRQFRLALAHPEPRQQALVGDVVGNL